MDLITDSLKTIIGVVTAILLAIFAKRWSDMKKRDRENKRQVVESVKATIIHTNDSTPLDDLVDRENESARRRNDS